MELLKEGGHASYEPRVMKKEKWKVHRERKDSYVDSEGNYHAHENSRLRESEVEIDQFGNPIERNEDGTIKRRGI